MNGTQGRVVSFPNVVFLTLCWTRIGAESTFLAIIASILTKRIIISEVVCTVPYSFNFFKDR